MILDPASDQGDSNLSLSPYHVDRACRAALTPEALAAALRRKHVVFSDAIASAARGMERGNAMFSAAFDIMFAEQGEERFSWRTYAELGCFGCLAAAVRVHRHDKGVAGDSWLPLTKFLSGAIGGGHLLCVHWAIQTLDAGEEEEYAGWTHAGMDEAKSTAYQKGHVAVLDAYIDRIIEKRSCSFGLIIGIILQNRSRVQEESARWLIRASLAHDDSLGGFPEETRIKVACEALRSLPLNEVMETYVDLQSDRYHRAATVHGLAQHAFEHCDDEVAEALMRDHVDLPASLRLLQVSSKRLLATSLRPWSTSGPCAKISPTGTKRLVRSALRKIVDERRGKVLTAVLDVMHYCGAVLEDAVLDAIERRPIELSKEFKVLAVAIASGYDGVVQRMLMSLSLPLTHEQRTVALGASLYSASPNDRTKTPPYWDRLMVPGLLDDPTRVVVLNLLSTSKAIKREHGGFRTACRSLRYDAQLELQAYWPKSADHLAAAAEGRDASEID